MNKIIKNCPFCASSEIYIEKYYYFYECNNCGCYGPTAIECIIERDISKNEQNRKDLALKLWNNRPLEN